MNEFFASLAIISSFSVFSSKVKIVSISRHKYSLIFNILNNYTIAYLILISFATIPSKNEVLL